MNVAWRRHHRRIVTGGSLPGRPWRCIVEPKGFVGARPSTEDDRDQPDPPRRAPLAARTPRGQAAHPLRHGLVISTVVAFTVLALVFGVLKLWGEVVSTVVANVVATFPAYVLNRRWVWGRAAVHT